ncbi:hypothetical protein POTOM_019306 [Populus tomentosa]|uniref:Uncharacterized protein n=1 Tax=Populus tomentosa TaxID=118781 RepID=A0A8X8A782_POPTO|nr:hypothetical protein POTOM_019306 [Populus tomentosa]
MLDAEVEAAADRGAFMEVVEEVVVVEVVEEEDVKNFSGVICSRGGFPGAGGGVCGGAGCGGGGGGGC